MKGVIFTEFLELVQSEFGLAVVDQIIEMTPLESQGAYTSVGTYNHLEIIALLKSLHQVTQVPISDLLSVYGKHLFNSLAGRYQNFLADVHDPFDLLSSLDSYIHVEVLKLYPDAELPKFEHEFVDDKTLKMQYQSCRPFAQLAEGLLNGCAEHFNNSIKVTLLGSSEDAQKAEFLIEKI